MPLICRIEQREELERLDRAMGEVPVAGRELVFLRFIAEMSYSEIAATTGESEAALRGKVFRGAATAAGRGRRPGECPCDVSVLSSDSTSHAPRSSIPAKRTPYCENVYHQIAEMAGEARSLLGECP